MTTLPRIWRVERSRVGATVPRTRALARPCDIAFSTAPRRNRPRQPMDALVVKWHGLVGARLPLQRTLHEQDRPNDSGLTAGSYLDSAVGVGGSAVHISGGPPSRRLGGRPRAFDDGLGGWTRRGSHG